MSPGRRRSFGERARASVRRARAGKAAGLTGFAVRSADVLRRFTGADAAAGTRSRRPVMRRHGESAQIWEERSHDGHDDRQLAALRAELDRELGRLARPPDER
jgi:hypothetical protein